MHIILEELPRIAVILAAGLLIALLASVFAFAGNANSGNADEGKSGRHGTDGGCAGCGGCGLSEICARSKDESDNDLRRAGDAVSRRDD